MPLATQELLLRDAVMPAKGAPVDTLALAWERGDLAALARGMGVEYLAMKRNEEVESVLRAARAITATNSPPSSSWRVKGRPSRKWITPPTWRWSRASPWTCRTCSRPSP